MKQTTIIVSKDGRPSMRKVYEQMTTGILDIIRTPRKGNRYIRRYVEQNVAKYNKVAVQELNYPDNIVIRWGNRVPVSTNEHTITYNKSEAIKNGTNKKVSREIFIANGVRCPKIGSPEDFTNEQYPIIARPFTHSKGKNFVILNNKEEFENHYAANNNGWYYSEFIDKEREFRIHCAHGKVLCVMEKPKAKGIAWNRAQNHEAFERVKQDGYIHDVCLQAVRATTALGLDFAGVDVILKNDLAYVLEANTSPTLNSSDYTSLRYAKYFDWLCRSDKRREHHNYSEWKNAISFAWKEQQLSS